MGTVSRLPLKRTVKNMKGEQFEVFLDGLVISWAYYRVVEHDIAKARVLFNYIMEIQRTGEKTCIVPKDVYDMIEPAEHQTKLAVSVRA